MRRNGRYAPVLSWAFIFRGWWSRWDRVEGGRAFLQQVGIMSSRFPIQNFSIHVGLAGRLARRSTNPGERWGVVSYGLECSPAKDKAKLTRQIAQSLIPLVVVTADMQSPPPHSTSRGVVPLGINPGTLMRTVLSVALSPWNGQVSSNPGGLGRATIGVSFNLGAMFVNVARGGLSLVSAWGVHRDHRGGGSTVPVPKALSGKMWP